MLLVGEGRDGHIRNIVGIDERLRRIADGENDFAAEDGIEEIAFTEIDVVGEPRVKLLNERKTRLGGLGTRPFVEPIHNAQEINRGSHTQMLEMGFVHAPVA